MRTTIIIICFSSFIMLLCNEPSETKVPATTTKALGSTQLQNDSMIKEYIKQLESNFKEIPSDRKAELDKLSKYIKAQADSNKPIKLTFICTHNSRRSHMGQIWAATAAAHYGIDNIECYSGGTEATAFNPRAVAALQRAGINIEPLDTMSVNPKYKVHIPAGKTLICFSKKYTDLSNPSTGFAAVMTCSKADAECPFVSGAAFRVAIPYEDPKEADNTPEEKYRYNERCKQIGTEMMYVFSGIK